ncbi:MAG: cation:proton antiporter [Actinomycetota bacterium]|nr:cation:proton antiporter [Actinomycetota bacterium]
MHDLTSFGLTVLLVAGALSAALLAAKVSARTSVPAAALFLVAAAAASDVFPSLVVSISSVERVGTLALIVILFDGGSSIGLRRFRASWIPIASLGVVGTFATAGLVALFVHAAFGLGWITSGLLGAAIAPTDPAVMFSVLGDREVGGRTGTILEGESGANDPVGIALMLGMIELATHSHASFWVVVRVFCEQMSIGLAIGIAGGLLESLLLRRVALPSSGLYTVRTLALAGIVYGAATVAHGSGFLAVFVAGLIVGDVQAPFKREIEVFQDGLSTIGEVLVFVVLGLTIDISSLEASRWLEGLAIAAFVALVARPLVAAALLAPAHLRPGERMFVAWGGLKGAVPILLAAFALAEHVHDAQRIYETVFVVVLASVLVQGGTIPLAARRFGVEMRRVTPGDEPAGQ